MKTIPILRVDFRDAIEGHQIPAFRALVTERLGRERDLFHNHQPDGTLFHRYPLVQYKRKRGRASLLCLGEAAAEGQLLMLDRSRASVLRDGTRLPLRIREMRQQQFDLGFSKEMLPYRLRNYLALNQQNYAKFQGLGDLAERSAFLQTKLRNHLVALCYGLGFKPEHPIEVRVDQLDPIRWVKLKGLKVAAFNLRFRCNLNLPQGIGVGKASSRGYGVLFREVK